jgi:hypothetical protein
MAELALVAAANQAAADSCSAPENLKSYLKIKLKKRLKKMPQKRLKTLFHIL